MGKMFLGKYRDFGLLFLRVGIGTMFLFHGIPKIFGGPQLWTQLGGAMAGLGITAYPVFWGFMAAVAEFCGGLALILGLAFRPACALLAITMAVAAHTLFTKSGLLAASQPIEDGILFLSLIFIGPGKHSFDEKIESACCCQK